MTTQILRLTSDDIRGFNEIENAVLECAEGLHDGEIADRYDRIGEILLANASVHDLDEDIVNLQSFARCVACELLSKEMQARHFRGNCWALEPPVSKWEGRNRDSSEIRSIDKQKIAMTLILLRHLERDPKYLTATKVLIDYETRYELWGNEDAINRD